MQTILEVNNVSKVIQNEIILNDITISIQAGEIYGLLGPNGAGKTTLMKVILSLLRIDSGSISILGNDLENSRQICLQSIGSIIEIPAFYEHMTAQQVLQLQADYLNFSDNIDINTLLARVGLQNTSKPIKSYSLGMKQRLGIARALIGNPKLLILDEPINGLDPQGVHEMRQLFTQLAKDQGIAILISSHILSEIAQIADNIGIIKSGQLIHQISMQELNDKAIDLETFFLEGTY